MAGYNPLVYIYIFCNILRLIAMFGCDASFSRSTPQLPFQNSAPALLTFPHRRVERPVPCLGHHFQQQESVRATVKMASTVQGFYSNETPSHASHNFLRTFSLRRPSTGAGMAVREPLERTTPTAAAVFAMRAQPGASPGTPLVWGGGYGTSRRVDHLHRAHDTCSAAFQPLGYPRGVLRLSESGTSRSFNRPPTTGCGPSIFSCTPLAAPSLQF